MSAPMEHNFAFDSQYDSPEELVAGVWMEVLGLDSVDATESIFDLGGTSIQAEQIAARLMDTVMTEISGVDVLRTGTVQEMARLLRERLAGAEP
jgi:iturin family lipopeptide synthetase A